MVATATKVPKVDFRRELGDLYDAGDEPTMVEVPEIHFLMIDGHGDPNRSAEFRKAVEALYAVAYALKFRVRRLPDGVDFEIMPLEGCWWIPDARVWDFDDKSDWDWTLMVALPEVVTSELAADVKASVRERRRMATLDLVRFEPFEEGPCAHVLHRGPFSAERPTLERLYGFIKDRALMPVGKHHEIYLTDPQRTADEDLRTIIRQPVAPRAGAREARNR
ncbi:MAG TPA: GyrI-like domain-containing protein [Actinomycetota bacterium]|jgi:hypothetical protein|nr:GyrI-like domain-containing protein [Actinomycetota bacterium]